MEKLEGIVSALVIETIRGQLKRIEALDQDIAEIEKKLALWKKEAHGAVRRLMAIPGVGLLSATAAVATMGDAKTFKSRSESSPLFWGWCPARVAPEDGSSCYGDQASAVTCTCARCSFTVRAR